MNVGFRPGCDETAVWRLARGAGTGGVAVKFFIAFDTKRKRRASRIFSKNWVLLEFSSRGDFQAEGDFFCGSAREISYKICVSAQIAQLSIFSERYFWMQGTVCVLRLQLLLFSRRFSLHWMSLSERRIDSSNEILPE